MSKQQWGNGYHRGYNEAIEKDGSLIGLWFHSKKDGVLDLQGKIIRKLESGDAYLVQLYEWFMGEESKQKVFSCGEMKDWDFYGTAEEMKERGDEFWERFLNNQRNLETYHKMVSLSFRLKDLDSAISDAESVMAKCKVTMHLGNTLTDWQKNAIGAFVCLCRDASARGELGKTTILQILMEMDRKGLLICKGGDQ
jgi:hypothetical protein